MARTALNFPSGSEHKELKPRQLMEAGYSAVALDNKIIAGGSTACVAVARSDGFLEVAKYASLSSPLPDSAPGISHMPVLETLDFSI